MATTEAHPFHESIDEIVQSVKSGEVTIETVQWRLEQALALAEIEIEALTILGHDPRQEGQSA